MQTEELYKIYLAHPIVTTDSRNCPDGSIFFALKGETFDGNAYALQALGKGCAYAVVDNPQIAQQDERLLLVDDVLTALQQLAAHHRRCWAGTVIQITGTNGKTTTKELLGAVLSQTKNVLYTQGNLNNHIGVPLTLLRITSQHEVAVVETGANHPGEIALLSQIVQADYGLITNVGRAHLEGFGGFEGVKQTKGELYDNLVSRGKKIFLNTLDADLCQMAQSRGYCIPQNALPYVEAKVNAEQAFVQLQWREEGQSSWHQVDTHLIGTYNLPNLCAAVTVGLHFGVIPAAINQALSEYIPTNSRSEMRSVGTNRLLVDAYNANPSSMEAALQNFTALAGEHKVVILGDMRELGEESLLEHERVLERLQQMELEQIWLVGDEFGRAIHDKPFAANPAVRIFQNVEQVKDVLRANPLTHATILIKGSNGTRLFELPAEFSA